MFASLNGHLEIVKFLFENNADINIQDDVFLFILNYFFLSFFFHLFLKQY
jgi:ankyrin repeat protein